MTGGHFSPIIKRFKNIQKFPGMSKEYINKSLEKALSIIELFSLKEKKLSATEIARRLDTTPGAIYPLLHTLERHGYLERDGSKKYSLGLKFLERGNLILQQLDVQDKAKPYLRELADTLKVNAHLAVLYEGKVLYLHREEGYPSVIIKEVVGRQVPAYCTALGKVLLAAMPEGELEGFLRSERLEPLTPNTITDPRELREELERVRDQGYAIDNEEFHEGNMCVAAPVRNYQGKVVAAISISFPKVKFPSNKETYIRRVKEAAVMISQDLGFELGKQGR